MTEILLKQAIEDLRKSLHHLNYSHKKISSYPTDPKKLSEEELETWESYCARFTRASD